VKDGADLVSARKLPGSLLCFLIPLRAVPNSVANLTNSYFYRGESISDHMYRMSIITMCAPKLLTDKLDIPKCIKMALIHDMAEALVGDITPVDGIVKAEKNRRESTTMEYLTQNLLGRFNGGSTGKDLMQAWQEYEDGETLESKFVRDVDKLELILQMLDYERAHEHELDLGDFSWVASRIELPEVKEWAAEVLRGREEFWGGRPHAAYSAEKPPEEKSLAQKVEYYGGKV
jgi:putative hydrolase of HD superfamily